MHTLGQQRRPSLKYTLCRPSNSGGSGAGACWRTSLTKMIAAVSTTARRTATVRQTTNDKELLSIYRPIERAKSVHTQQAPSVRAARQQTTAAAARQRSALS